MRRNESTRSLAFKRHHDDDDDDNDDNDDNNNDDYTLTMPLKTQYVLFFLSIFLYFFVPYFARYFSLVARVIFGNRFLCVSLVGGNKWKIFSAANRQKRIGICTHIHSIRCHTRQQLLSIYYIIMLSFRSSFFFPPILCIFHFDIPHDL